jgi:hypothetical protein
VAAACHAVHPYTCQRTPKPTGRPARCQHSSGSINSAHCAGGCTLTAALQGWACLLREPLVRPRGRALLLCLRSLRSQQNLNACSCSSAGTAHLVDSVPKFAGNSLFRRQCTIAAGAQQASASPPTLIRRYKDPPLSSGLRSACCALQGRAPPACQLTGSTPAAAQSCCGRRCRTARAGRASARASARAAAAAPPPAAARAAAAS